jgi:hypothetical protein
MELSRQQNQIVSILRDREWHCGLEWLDGMKDDRARISALNNDGTNNKPKGYMFIRGYEIVGERCTIHPKGFHSSGLFMRRAVKIDHIADTDKMVESWESKRLRSLIYFNSLPA